MKQSTLFTLALLFSFTLLAQNSRIKASQVQLSAAVGLLPTYAVDQSQAIVLPLSVGAEVFLSPNMALGVYGAYSRAEGQSIFLNADVVENYDNTTKQLAVKTSFYSNDLSGWRVYGGVLAGVSHSNIDKTSTPLHGEGDKDLLPSFTRPNPPTSFLFSGFVGAQRMLTSNVAVHGELGFGISLANVGLSYRF